MMRQPTSDAIRPPANALPLKAMRVVVAALAIGLLPTFLIGALSVPISDELEVGAATVGGSVSAFFLAAALTSVTAGRQVDRRGAAFGYRTGLTGVGLMAAAIGGFAAAGWHLVVAFAIAGMSLAFVDPSITRTITGSVGWRRQGIAFGVKEAAVPSASMLAGITLPLLGETVGWQVPFLVVAACSLGLAALVPGDIERPTDGPASRRGPRRDTDEGAEPGRRPQPDLDPDEPTVSHRSPRNAHDVGSTGGPDVGDTEGHDVGGTGGHDVGSTDDLDVGGTGGHDVGGTDDLDVGHTGDLDVGTGARNVAQDPAGQRDNSHRRDPSGGLLLLALASGLGGGAGAAVATFIVPTGIVIGMGATAAGLVLSAASLGSIGIRLGAGWFVDRRPSAVLDLLVLLLAAGLVGGIALAAAAHLGAAPVEVDAFAGAVDVAGETGASATGAIALLVLGAVLLLGPGWGWTGLVFLTATRLTPQRPAQASGAILAGLGGGGAVFPVGAGWLAESVGFGWTWTVVAIAMSLSVALMMVVRARAKGR